MKKMNYFSHDIYRLDLGPDVFLQFDDIQEGRNGIVYGK